MEVRRTSLLTLLVAVAVPCLLLVLFLGVREAPLASCGQLPPPDYDELVAGYQAWAEPIYLVAALLVVAPLGALSLARREARAKTRRPGAPTTLLLALYLAFLTAIALDRDVAEDGVILAWLGIVFYPLALALAVLTAVLTYRRSQRAAAFAMATAWVVAWALLPGVLGWVLTVDEPLCLH